jgi:hypothetical protein
MSPVMSSIVFCLQTTIYKSKKYKTLTVFGWFMPKRRQLLLQNISRLPGEYFMA